MCFINDPQSQQQRIFNRVVKKQTHNGNEKLYAASGAFLGHFDTATPEQLQDEEEEYEEEVILTATPCLNSILN